MYFKNHFIVKVTYRKEEYVLDCHVEHMLIGKESETWYYSCDKFGRTGTSQCFSVLRFKLEGVRQNGLLTTDGMTVTAITPNDKYIEVKTFEVLDADDLDKKTEGGG